jgi:hypothetical protein
MIEWLLNKLFQRFDIDGREDGEIYLRRWCIYPRDKEFKKLEPRLYLHKFYNGDRDRDLHDHPWSFSSLILWGGYWEHSWNPFWKQWKASKFLQMAAKEPEQYVKKWYGPGSFLRRGAKWSHKVELPVDKQGGNVPCWTIVWTGVKERSWGFHTDNGWCYHKNYEHGICWCYEGEDGNTSHS